MYEPGVQAWYNQSIIVDPANPNHLFVGLEEEYQSFNAGADMEHDQPVLELHLPVRPDQQLRAGHPS